MTTTTTTTPPSSSTSKILTTRKISNKIIKILILGTGESGKSTLVKQMKIIHNDGYSREEMLEFRPIILDNLVSSMKYVVTGMRLLDIDFQYSTNQELAKDLILCNKYFDDYHILFPHIEYTIKTLWQDNGVRKAVARGFEYELNDSALYYFENIDRITNEKYVPNTNDIVKSRIRTIEFICDNHIIRMYDVGGQRSERRKWIQCFEDVRTLLFVVAISEYDMTLVEDSSRNRLKESLLLFENISNNLFFHNTCTILFLNKFDLFRQKILFTDRQLKYFFTEYQGPDYDAERSSKFIENQFRQIAQQANCNKTLHTHYTTATDTVNIKQTFDSIVDTIVRDNICHSTLL
ncbi:Guanine nucleotide-binding protein subunit alpha-13 [Dermatophagoides farinae]|uniref:Guanine nucleotide-binding protein subunit alpha-13 n=1 Tax=Dermatophagoides farinae TaxID=6954 RepID=A0A922HQD3_DERFA|nr:Guanine nucleotide-binding protein subunit alpha-13 [Dermatophagoides farinae]